MAKRKRARSVTRKSSNSLEQHVPSVVGFSVLLAFVVVVLAIVVNLFPQP